ncbi:MAG: ribose-phosphate pyrophosphokinase [Lachnospiraceae bacterium]|nr:ribose-phosphate pyrophosphokinase [Lachnospiraceae bacterium]MBQ7777101.1 ribose-phosphate pyrophosphokinase [Lachnospiraceae bacterium]
MIKLNDKQVDLKHFPDGTLLLKEPAPDTEKVTITWLFENNEEFVALYFLTKHLQAKGIADIDLRLPYIPNARQDRVKAQEDVFTLKYFAELINDLKFSKVKVLDPHSYVSEALIDHIDIQTPKKYVEKVLEELKKQGENNILMFFPDEGAMKRYSTMFELPYAFGMKKRDWTTGQIQGLDVAGQTEFIKDSTVLIVDDICSKGGTFYYSAKALKELGAGKVYLYISHCENSIFEGELLTTDLIEKVYTTNSIFTKEHEKVEVFQYE